MTGAPAVEHWYCRRVTATLCGTEPTQRPWTGRCAVCTDLVSLHLPGCGICRFIAGGPAQIVDPVGDAERILRGEE